MGGRGGAPHGARRGRARDRRRPEPGADDDAAGHRAGGADRTRRHRRRADRASRRSRPRAGADTACRPAALELLRDDVRGRAGGGLHREPACAQPWHHRRQPRACRPVGGTALRGAGPRWANPDDRSGRRADDPGRGSLSGYFQTSLQARRAHHGTSSCRCWPSAAARRSRNSRAAPTTSPPWRPRRSLRSPRI